MNRCLFLILILSSFAPPLQAETIDLRQAELLALERNLDLQAQVFETRASAAAVDREVPPTATATASFFEIPNLLTMG
jgi:hypothetical protein